MMANPNMSHKDPDPTTPRPEGPLGNLVEDKLNKPLPRTIAELEKESEEPERSGVTDYAHGTAEHSDDSEP
jgi:hypothetical protein